jgi:hypothetical protein
MSKINLFDQQQQVSNNSIKAITTAKSDYISDAKQNRNNNVVIIDNENNIEKNNLKRKLFVVEDESVVDKHNSSNLCVFNNNNTVDLHEKNELISIIDNKSKSFSVDSNTEKKTSENFNVVLNVNNSSDSKNEKLIDSTKKSGEILKSNKLFINLLLFINKQSKRFFLIFFFFYLNIIYSIQILIKRSSA